MYRLFLAVRYLWSRPLSWISMVAIWLSVMAMIATISIMSGFLRETKGMIRGISADLELYPDWVQDPRQDVLLPPPPFEVLRPVLAAEPDVVAACPRLVRWAVIKVPNVSPEALRMGPRFTDRDGINPNIVQLIGVEPEHEREASAFFDYVARVADPAQRADDIEEPFRLEHVPLKYKNQDLPTVLVGSRLFHHYGLQKGQVITLVTVPETLDEESIKPLSQRFLVAGAVNTGHFRADFSMIYTSLGAARRFAESSSDATDIVVKARPGADLAALRDGLRSRFAKAGFPVEVRTWRDLHASTLGAVDNERSLLTIILFFFVAVATFNVFATMMVMVSDKTRDIGVLAALGATPRGILGLFTGCGLVMSIFAAALGTLSGVLISLNVNAIDLGVEKVFGARIFNPSIYFFSEIPVELEPGFVAVVFLVTVAFAVLCALFPALRAARMDPVAALRHE